MGATFSNLGSWVKCKWLLGTASGRFKVFVVVLIVVIGGGVCWMVSASLLAYVCVCVVLWCVGDDFGMLLVGASGVLGGGP